MSLSFVTSAVLSSTDGVSHNEETPVEQTKETNATFASRAAHKPLFEQLRSNADAAQEEYDEMTKAMMRGTRLDEEDVAHLNSVEQLREERENAVRRGVELEVEMFKAKRAEMGMIRSEIVDDEDVVEELADAAVAAKVATSLAKEEKKGSLPLASIRPKIIVTKKRKRRTNNTQDSSAASHGKKLSKDDGLASDVKKENPKSSGIKDTKQDKSGKSNSSVTAEDRKNDDKSSDNNEALGGLLGCYGSDSDED